MRDIKDTLSDRGKSYGSFEEQARIGQNIKLAMMDSPNWCNLAPDQREALEMVAHKMARALNGNPDIFDTWHDMGGYALLVARRLDPHQ